MAPVISKFKNTKWLSIFFMGMLFGGFLILTSEVNESLSGKDESIGKIDQGVLNLMLQYRTQKINGIAIDITALGSATVLTAITIFLCVFLALKKKTILAYQFFLAVSGSAILTSILKFYFERSRPPITFRLVDVQGYSYPSGHSLSSAAAYFSIAILFSKQVDSKWGRGVAWTLFLGLIAMIGITRLYLGVHFFSDVMAGILIGIAWASLVEYTISYFQSSNN